jgi:hypothetical protein
MDVLSWAATQGFLPHGYCFQWSPTLLSLMVTADAITALAYYSIPLALLVYLDRNRKDIKIGWVFLLFAPFIFACGTTHVVDIVTIWWPAYWLQAWVKALTALVSIATAILIWPMALKATDMLVPQRRINALEEEIEALKQELAQYKSA